MSGEQLTAKEPINTSRVNINDLLSKVKQEEKKEKKDNYIFLGLICAVIAFTGIVASL